YSRIHNEGVILRFAQQSEAAITFSYVGVARTDDYHQTEFFAAALLRACRHITGRNLSPAAVRFVHRRQHVTSEVRAFFGCEISFGSVEDQVVFPLKIGRASCRER